MKSVTIGKDGYTLDDILIHDMKSRNNTIHYMLTQAALPDLPVAMGVIRACEDYVYESMLTGQVEEARERASITTMNELLRSGNTFEVE